MGERLIVWSDGGLLEAEYALFDGVEIVLHASDPVTVREAGYMTTARQASARLAELGVTPELAAAAAKALRPETVLSFARGANARAVAGELGAQELFDGAIFRSTGESRWYEGAWLDLRMLGQGLGVPAGATLIQSLHLTATLSEVSGETPIFLSTAGTMRSRRPGERTHSRPSLAGAPLIVSALARLRPRTMPLDADPARDRRLHPALLARIRERLTKDSSSALQMHLAALDRTLSGLAKPAGPMSDGRLRALERQLDEGETKGVDEALATFTRSRGNGPEIRYLKARLSLLRGDDSPREIARALSDIADEQPGFHQAALVASRTWLAVGEDLEAVRLARKLADDASASDSERLVAQEILASIPAPKARKPTRSRPADTEVSPPSTVRMPPPPARAVGLGDLPPPRAVPALTDRPPPLAEPTAVDVPPPGRALAVVPRPPAPPRPPVAYIPELVESLPLPFGASEADLPGNVRPSSPAMARVSMIRLARDLARDYRLWYGKTLRCDVMAIDAMQQHLMRRYAGAAIEDEEVAWELRRHGALLSEIMARKLGGAWVDVSPTEPGYWTMQVGLDTRTHPIGRVYRFVALGQTARDLFSYFEEIENRARRG
ncbi:MAG TPA: hypothetical protein VIF09_00185 [Polyangiaceae bacterium]